MNLKIKKILAVVLLLAIAISASSLTAAANGIDTRTVQAPIDPTKDPFEPPRTASVPEDYHIRSNVNELIASDIVASSVVTFSGNVAILWNESFPGGSWVNAIQANDLDGDRKDDLILVVHNWITNTHTVIAKRGSDGTHLWEESVTNAWIDVRVPGGNVSRISPRSGDLDGDRLPDVVVTINNWSTNTNTVIAKRGIDGTHLWEKSVTGSAWMTAEFIDDLSGDRQADVLVILNDWSANTYSVSANRGNDGVALWQESGSGNAWISGTSDLDDDRNVDLLLTISNSPASVYAVIAKRGIDGTSLWQESVTGSAWIEARTAKDLNGDRIDDVLVTIHNWGTNTHIAKAKKGSDGTDLWQESVTNGWLYATPTDDLNGDRSADVLVTINNWGTSTYTVKAKKGSDGTDLWQESVTGSVGLNAVPTDDLNGDRSADVLVTINNWGTSTYTVKAKKGSDGTDLWQESVTGSVGLNAVPTDDLNGDRSADVLVTINNWGTSTYTVKTKKGSDGTDLWQATSSSSLWATPIGDLDRDRRENTLVGTSDTVYAVGIPG